MPVYTNRRKDRSYIEFQYKGKRYKKRLPKWTPYEEATALEKKLRADAIEERIVNGLDVYMDEPEPFTDATNRALIINRRSTKGILYIVQSSEIYKIGITDNFKQRLSALRHNTPHGLSVILILRISNANLVEKRLHTLFKDRRVKGEWFRLNSDDLEFLRCIIDRRVLFNIC